MCGEIAGKMNLEKILDSSDSGNVEPPDLFADMDSRILTAKEEALSRRYILDRVEKWMSACEEESWLEDHARDDNRYNASRRARINLKQAEKARIMVNTIPAMVENLVAKPRAWEEERGITFTYVLSHEREEEKLRMRLDDTILKRIETDTRPELKEARSRSDLCQFCNQSTLPKERLASQFCNGTAFPPRFTSLVSSCAAEPEQNQSACEEESRLEEYMRDDNRYNASRGAHINLKRAESARMMVNKIPATVENLLAKTRAWEEEHGIIFTYDGVPLLAMLDKYAMLRHEREEKKLRMRLDDTILKRIETDTRPEL